MKTAPIVRLLPLLAQVVVLTGSNFDEHALSGGEATVFDDSREAFAQPAPNLPIEQHERFFAGNAFFNTNWVAAAASADGRDGLGPLFNVKSCSACHFKDGRGLAPEPGEDPVSLLVRISTSARTERGGPQPDPIYGGQISPRALPDIQPEAKIKVAYEEIPGMYPDGETYSLRKPYYHIEEWAYGKPADDLQYSPRIAPGVFGLGLLDAVSEKTILAAADPEDLDGDGISGRPNLVWDREDQVPALGRYGWKANQAGLLDQVVSAFQGDIGITSSHLPVENHMLAQASLNQQPSGGSPEISDIAVDDVVFYLQTLAAPARRDVSDAQVQRGENLFAQIDCAMCHTPAMITASDYEVSELADQRIQPFTDLLLHDMGPGLVDGRPDFEATGSEWRTPPLWGLGLYETVNGRRDLMHDGRARTLEEAILWHGGEAEQSKLTFMRLPKPDREAVLVFLESL